MTNKAQKLVTATMTTLVMLWITFSAAGKSTSDLTKAAIIPKPVSVKATGGLFNLSRSTAIYVNGESKELIAIGQYLSGKLKTSTGFPLEVKSIGKTPGSGNIYLMLAGNNSDARLGDEGYELIITDKLVMLKANMPSGLFRGIQTIRQLLPADVESSVKQKGPWNLATGTIVDYPVYSFRGVMLDVARHFFSVSDVEQLIEFLAYYKMNSLHLHLSDDQGWRIEIKSWPNLALHGGSTAVGGGQGGYYTQDQYSEIVKFAAARYINIIPEIDMPGHTNAALASYAELNCNGKATELYTGIEVGFSSLCTKADITYKFIDDVVKELAAITPGPYIHIGGDESHSTKREDYIPFVEKVEDIVLSHGKKIIGWDDIAISSLKPGVLAQHWANVKNANMAVEKGAKILMSPAVKAYLDMQYDKTTPLGLHWAAYIEVDSAYIWDPASYITGVKKENVQGIEAALWTETITNLKDMEYMIFPRLPGYAEIGWTPSADRVWNEYKVRLAEHGDRFKTMGINFYPSAKVQWKTAK